MTRRDISNDELAEAYVSGIGVAQIAKQFNCSVGIVRYRLKSSGVYKPKEQPKAQHGTRTMYTHHGCRCEACCRAEHEQYLKRPEVRTRKRTYSKWGDEQPCISDAKRRWNAARYYAIKSRPKEHSKRIHWTEIAEAFDMKCALCGGKCDPSDTWVNKDGRTCIGKNYPTVDHIIPISKGGCDTFDNVQLAHKQCNSLKGAKAVSA